MLMHKNFLATPFYFKLLCYALLIYATLPFFLLFYLPDMYDRGLSDLGEIFYILLVFNFFMVEKGDDRGFHSLTRLAISLAVLSTCLSVFGYYMHLSTLNEFPQHIGFRFFWFNWLDGVVFPWIVALMVYRLPKEALPHYAIDSSEHR